MLRSMRNVQVFITAAAMMYIKVLRDVAYVDHKDKNTGAEGDHATIELPEGIYEVRRQIEHFPWGQRQVAD